MKVLILNGSARVDGCTARALKEVSDVLVSEGIEVETITVGNRTIKGCQFCGGCKEGGCVIDDDVNIIAKKFEEADGLILGSPVYYAGCNGAFIAFLDRLFYSTRFSKFMKVGASVVSSRRAGSTSAFDELNKYFTGTGMVVASSNYWNEVHGNKKEDVEKDLEGLRTMRILGRNMAYIIKAINNYKQIEDIPVKEKGPATSFVDGK